MPTQTVWEGWIRLEDTTEYVLSNFTTFQYQFITCLTALYVLNTFREKLLEMYPVVCCSVLSQFKSDGFSALYCTAQQKGKLY